MLRCKPGDMAVVIRSRIPENLGLLVTVVAWDPTAFSWVVELAHPPALVVRGMPRQVAPYRPGETLTAQDHALRPLRGQHQPEAAATDTQEPAHA